MRVHSTLVLSLIIIVLTASASAAPPATSPVTIPSGIATLHDTAYIQSGELLMMVNNRGSFGYDQTAYLGKNDGLHYPGECPSTVMYAAGLWLGATVGGQIRVTAAEYAIDYTQGPIVGGLPAPDGPQHRVYKIRRGDTRSSNPDFLEWPFDDGAPALKSASGSDSLDANGLRIPMLQGDESIWTVFNDLSMSEHNSDPGSGSLGPLGVEVQLYAYAYDSASAVGRIIFMNYTIINKGGNSLDDVHLSLWADPDLGDPGDDFVACDTLLNLGYCYNADDNDQIYGGNPPTVGIGLLSGPIVQAPGHTAWSPGQHVWLPGFRNLGMTAFSTYYNGTDPSNNRQTWNYMRGRNLYGTPAIHPETGQATTFMVSGDPLTQSGWLDANAGDRRMMVTSGPFQLQQNDTQTVVLAVMIGSSYPFGCQVSIFDDTIFANHVAGTSDGYAYAIVTETDSTTGHEYQITMTGPAGDIRWHLSDITLGHLLLSDQANVSGEGDFQVVDGLVVKVIGSSPGVGGWEIPSGTRRFTWVGGDALALEGFNGAMTWDSPCHFFGVCDEPGVPANRLRRVLLKLAAVDANGNFNVTDSNLSFAYRYLRAPGSPAQPEFAPHIINVGVNYGFQAFAKSVPLSAWDIDAVPPRRLVVGHLENNVAGGMVDSKYWPPVVGTAENTAGSGPREWLFIFDVDYSETVNPEFTGSALIDNLPIMYMSMANRRTGLPWESGDEFLIIPVDSNLFFSEADTFSFTAPLPGTATARTNETTSNLTSITNLRHLDSVAQAKFEETHWTCACPCLADPACSGASTASVNVMDIIGFIDVAFRSVPAVLDRPCPTDRTDITCDHVTDIRDVVTVIDVAFRGADPVLRFCNPCNQP